MVAYIVRVAASLGYPIIPTEQRYAVLAGSKEAAEAVVRSRLALSQIVSVDETLSEQEVSDLGMREGEPKLLV